jgi:carboxymethylenebutenolidase
MTATANSAIETDHITLTVSDGTTMPAYTARPLTGGNGRGLIVFQEAFGVNHHIRDVAERFAREGYTVIAPALFHRTDPTFEVGYTDFSLVMPHMNAVTVEGLSADARAAYSWLTDSAGGNVSDVACTGYCLGGRVSFLAASILPLKAAVSYYGGGIAPNPERGSVGLLDRAGDLKSPILLLWGGKDASLPPAQPRQVDDALIAAGKPHATITFSEADHGFFCNERASYNPDAAKQAWPLTLAFLDAAFGA